MKQQPKGKPKPGPKLEPKHEHRASEVLYGLRAGLAVLERRPDDLLSVSFSRDLKREMEPMLRACAAKRLSCREVSEDELTRLSGSRNHEGLVIEVKPRVWLGLNDLGDRLLRTRAAAIALDRVRNPYNIGAIVRSAAFFGIDAVLLGAPAPHPGLPPDAIRVAEGGAESLSFGRTTDLADTLSRLRARGIAVVGAESEGAVNVFSYSFTKPVVLVLGHEREGLSDRVKAQCDALVAIAGSGSVGSLNVSIAASVLIAEVMRKDLVSAKIPATQKRK